MVCQRRWLQTGWLCTQTYPLQADACSWLQLLGDGRCRTPLHEQVHTGLQLHWLRVAQLRQSAAQHVSQLSTSVPRLGRSRPLRAQGAGKTYSLSSIQPNNIGMMPRAAAEAVREHRPRCLATCTR